VLATPAWRRTAFDTGHVMLVLNNQPYDPQESFSEAATEHLLGE